MPCYCKDYKSEVSIEYPLYQSKQGNYFIGQTPVLIDNGQHVLASLYNPVNSNVNIYVNAMTITNVSNSNLPAQFYLKSNLHKALISKSVSCTNQSIVPEPIPKGKIKYSDTADTGPKNGVSIFSRIVSPNTTQVIDGGQIIIPPGESIVIYIGDFLPVNFDSIIIAFGWWEEKICRY